jgi:uncharacterized protein (TIGR03086 family)
MREPEVFVLADRTLDGVVREIEDDQWDREMPGRGGGTVRDAIDEQAREDALVPDILSGKTAGELRPDEDLLGHNPYRDFTDIVDRACSAALDLDDLDRIVHTSFGDVPARAYFWHANTSRGLLAHDVSRAIGSNEELPDDLVRGMYEEVREHGDELRAMGLLPAAAPVPEDAPILVLLLALCGRDPALL